MAKSPNTLRAAGALLALAVAVALAWPLPPGAGARTFGDLLAPIAVGRAVARGYVLQPLRRGEEHDVVLVAEKGASTVELHVLPRGSWSDVRMTPSFDVGYETERSTASHDDCEAVAEAVKRALAAHDPGGLPAVDAIPLVAGAPPPTAMRVLDRVTGVRGAAIGVALVGGVGLAASLPWGAAWAALVLAALGLALRLPALGVPFVHDQDVQRLFTGHLPLGRILTGAGLVDRHPPLYFVVLHFTQWFGQGEAVVRLPAVVSGALVGPAIIWAAQVLRRPVIPAAIAGLAATCSAELVLRSREVSEIPLFGLLAVAMSVSLLAFAEAPSRRRGVAVAVSHGLALWTYYLAPLYMLGEIAALALLGRVERRALRWIGAGVVAGAPAIALGIATIFRDSAARRVAGAHPHLAWGSHRPLEMARHVADVALGAVGVPLALLVALVVVVAVVRRDAIAITPIAAFVVTFLGIALVAPFARAQPYYIVAVLPAAFLAVGLGADKLWSGALLAAVVAVFAVPRTVLARDDYVASADAFMPAFARSIAARPERRVVTVAHYDATLLAYYLARERGVPVDWARLDAAGKALIPLSYSHALGAHPGEAALRHLDALLASGPLLVVEREAFRLPEVSERLRACTRLDASGSGRLYACRRAR